METEQLKIGEKNNFIELLRNILEKAVNLDAESVYFGDAAAEISFIKDGEAFHKFSVPSLETAKRLAKMALLHAGMTLPEESEPNRMLVGIADHAREIIEKTSEISGELKSGYRQGSKRRTAKTSGAFSLDTISNIIFQVEKPAAGESHRIIINLWKSGVL